MHYYQHHIGDFIKDTANLDDHQLATYLRMIWAYYSDEKPFTNDIDRIAFAMRSDEKTVGLILRHYFKEAAEGWRHGRCDREIAEFHSKKEKASASANARWKNPNKNANALPTESNRNANASKNDANQEPITNNQEPLVKEKQSSDKSDMPAGFALFWKTWPSTQRKTAKAECLKKWKARKLEPLTETIVAHVDAMKLTETWRKGYEPAPVTYINQSRWEDGLPAPDKPAGKVATVDSAEPRPIMRDFPRG